MRYLVDRELQLTPDQAAQIEAIDGRRFGARRSTRQVASREVSRASARGGILPTSRRAIFIAACILAVMLLGWLRASASPVVALPDTRLDRGITRETSRGMTRHLPESSAGFALLNPRAGTSTVSESQQGQNAPVDDELRLASNPTAPTDHVGRQLTQSDAEDLKAFLKAFDEAFGGLTQKRSEEAVTTNNEQHRPEHVRKEN